MNENLNRFFEVTDPEALLQIESGQCHGLNFYVYWKDLKGRYKGVNQRLIKDIGLNSDSDIVNRTDFDFVISESANFLRMNDLQTIEKNNPKVYFESLSFQNGLSHVVVSQKSPWLSTNGKTLGVVGLSIYSNRHDESMINSESILTKRQTDCMYYLIKGYTCKAIGKKLKLSPRTVEHYFEAIKLKLNCDTRSQLIEAGLNIPEIKLKLLI